MRQLAVIAGWILLSSAFAAAQVAPPPGPAISLPAVTAPGDIGAAAAMVSGCTTHQFVTEVTSSSSSCAQPACSDLSDAAASCATDATNAANISSGMLPAARLPNPTATTLGGVESLAAAAHKYINQIGTSGLPSAARPECADLTDAAASCNVDATNASNISSGTLPVGRLPASMYNCTGSFSVAAAGSHDLIATGSFGATTTGLLAVVTGFSGAVTNRLYAITLVGNATAPSYALLSSTDYAGGGAAWTISEAAASGTSTLSLTNSSGSTETVSYWFLNTGGGTPPTCF